MDNKHREAAWADFLNPEIQRLADEANTGYLDLKAKLEIEDGTGGLNWPEGSNESVV